MASKVLKEDLEENYPRPQGRPRNDYEAALEICQRALPADRGVMHFSDEIRSVNCLGETQTRFRYRYLWALDRDNSMG
ncbi:uncharacterized protein EAE98_008020 [Botrytis deweyae]|uniref:Uncharacterized protein n=1 Tax=Botrytis deweyae TaxID=2478750 RepID=A0ABQ7IFQ8_9HELO|nr:uncharacterized protein EAE98_008020 [Botrytis deweyae]KAF7922494.1 hypothetical protein EAE98_008020 [Botrytis deweyae]